METSTNDVNYCNFVTPFFHTLNLCFCWRAAIVWPSSHYEPMKFSRYNWIMRHFVSVRPMCVYVRVSCANVRDFKWSKKRQKERNTESIAVIQFSFLCDSILLIIWLMMNGIEVEQLRSLIAHLCVSKLQRNYTTTEARVTNVNDEQ